jgi:hypothetical protein
MNPRQIKTSTIIIPTFILITIPDECMTGKSALCCLGENVCPLTLHSSRPKWKAINVSTPPGTTAETSQRPNGKGGVDLEVTVKQIISKDIQAGGQVFKAMRIATGSAMVPIVR